MSDLKVSAIEALTYDCIEALVNASVAEGYAFLHQLWDEYESGDNRFDIRGAVLLGVFDYAGELIAIGGIHRDPYLKRDDIARVRHVYVRKEWRRSGVGRLLMTALIDHAVRHFDVLTLRTVTEHGDAFYASLGFSRKQQYENATHWLRLRSVI